MYFSAPATPARSRTDVLKPMALIDAICRWEIAGHVRLDGQVSLRFRILNRRPQQPGRQMFSPKSGQNAQLDNASVGVGTAHPNVPRVGRRPVLAQEQGDFAFTSGLFIGEARHETQRLSFRVSRRLNSGHEGKDSLGVLFDSETHNAPRPP